MNEFKNQAEIWQHLLNGGLVISKVTSTIAKMIDGNLCFYPSRNSLNASFTSFSDWKPFVEPKWHDNIPEHGYYCYVSDKKENPDNTDYLAKVFSYKGRVFYTKDSWFNYATPVKPGELDKFILRMEASQ